MALSVARGRLNARTLRPTALRLLGWGAFWFFATVLAGVAAASVSERPLIAAVPAAVAVSTLACRRWPYAAFAALFALSGGFWSIEVFTGLPVGATADLLLVGLWLGTLHALRVADDPEDRWLWPGVVLALLFLTLSFLSVFAANDVYPALYTFRLSFWYMLAALLVAYVPLPRGSLWMLTRIALVVALLVAAYAVLRWVIGPAASESHFATSEGVRNYETINGELRLLGSMGTGHILSSWMAPFTVFCLALGMGLRGPWRFVALAATGLSGAALVGTDVRAGMVAAAAAGALVLVLTLVLQVRNSERLGRALVIAVLAVVGVGTVIVVEAGDQTVTSERFEAILHPRGDVSIQERELKWATALDEIDKRPFGQGLGTSGGAEKRYSRFTTISSLQIDSTYLKIALEQGFVVMVFFGLVLLALLAGLCITAVTSTSGLAPAVAAGSAGALLAFGIEMFFDVYIEGIAALGVWLIIGLGLRAASRREPEPT